MKFYSLGELIRGTSGRVLEVADLVTEMKKIKHPFDKGIKAVKGLDY